MPQIQTPESKGTRFLILIASAIAGLSLGWLVNCYELLAFMGIGFETHGAVSAVILVASLPTLIVLWWFRTHDTRQQIEKAQEQIQKTDESINANLFGIYFKMLHAKEKEERLAGILGMMNMKRRNILKERIDSATEQSINLSEADLSYKSLSGMCLNGANFEKAKMLEIHFDSAELRGANFSHADLSYATLDGASLAGANFSHANLTESQLVDLEGRQAIFTDANLSQAIMARADFSCADFSRANMRNSQLDGANLFLSNLTKADLTDATYNKETRFPDGFDPKAAGMELVEIPHRRKPSDEGADGE